MAENKILKAIYYPKEEFFKIPKNINLEDKSKVKKYYVRRGTLYIEFVDKSEIEIECIHTNDDEECPEEVKIENLEEYSFLGDEDEDN